ncbi:MAG TPA: glycosyltransferase 87 family protein [Solirubrobacteraceae bacterium]
MLSAAHPIARPRTTAATTLRGGAGIGALAAIGVAGVVLAAAAAGQRLRFFVPAAQTSFPGWMRGPLAHLGVRLDPHAGALLLVALFACYLIAVACAAAIPGRLVIVTLAGLQLVFLLAPPMFSADVFGYIDYARLGAIHGLDPYLHGAAGAPDDSVAQFVRWHDAPSPYGPLFTVAGYALAHLSVAATYWIYKVVAALSGLGCVAIVWRIAARGGGDPRRAALFVGLNPLFVVYGVGGAHNDLLVELFVVAAIAAALRGGARSAGAQVAVAGLLKISTGLVFPFLLLSSARRGRLLAGALLVTALVGVASLLVLGGRVVGFVPQIIQQQRLVARYSIPSELGFLLGQGGLTPAIRIGCAGALIVVVTTLLWRTWRGADWVAAAGWATLTVLLTTAWLTPWYAVWVLPLAAISPSTRLRAATLGFCTYVMVTRVVPYLA